jgi:hypothetical protein
MGRSAMFLILLMCLASAASAQKVSKGGVSGKLQTYRAIVGPAPASPVTILTTPAKKKGIFILTQACANNEDGFILDSGSPALTIVSASAGAAFRGNSRCVTYSPGLAIPPSTAITCNNGDTNNSNACSVTGVLSQH